MINENNIEEYIIEYLDDELDAETSAQLLAYIKNHPEYELMMEDYRKVYLDIEDSQMEFPNKQMLIKREPKRLNLWIPLGLVASIAAIVGVFILLDQNGEGAIANQNDTIAHNQQTVNSDKGDGLDTSTTKQLDSHFVASTPAPHSRMNVYRNTQIKSSESFSKKENNRIQQSSINNNLNHLIIDESYASIPPIQVNTNPQKIEVNQVIEVGYVAKIPIVVTESIQPSDVDVTIVGIPVNQEAKQIKNFQEKFEKAKEKFADNLAQLSGLSFTLIH